VQILCLAVLSVVSLVTAVVSIQNPASSSSVVSIQLLRLGLLHKTVDGQSFQRDTLREDAVLLVALAKDLE